jgi:hypothetical protein
MVRTPARIPAALSLLAMLALAAFQAPAAQAEGGIFNSPKYNGGKIANCLTPGKSCGKAVADKFCKNNGYSNAAKYLISDETYQAVYMGNGIYCRACKILARVRCGITVESSTSTEIGSVNN